MPKISAGLLVYRVQAGTMEVLLVHPGGPYFRNKDEGAWTIPKGEPAEREDLLNCAQREFAEETGWQAVGPFQPLAAIKQKGGKIVHAWAAAGDFDPATLRCNPFTIEWPPKSGQQTEFPEIDRAEYFDLGTARRKINAGQVDLVEQLERLLT